MCVKSLSPQQSRPPYRTDHYFCPEPVDSHRFGNQSRRNHSRGQDGTLAMGRRVLSFQARPHSEYSGIVGKTRLRSRSGLLLSNIPGRPKGLEPSRQDPCAVNSTLGTLPRGRRDLPFHTQVIPIWMPPRRPRGVTAPRRSDGYLPCVLTIISPSDSHTLHNRRAERHNSSPNLRYLGPLSRAWSRGQIWTCSRALRQVSALSSLRGGGWVCDYPTR